MHLQFVARNDTKTTSSVKAKREIVIAAGAPRTPGLLQLSGVGLKNLLTGLEIEVVEDLPGVGYNFHDQPATFTGVTCTSFIYFAVKKVADNAERQFQQIPIPDA